MSYGDDTSKNLAVLQKAIKAAKLDQWNPDFLNPRFREIPKTKQEAQVLVQYLCPGAFSGDIFSQTFTTKFRDVLSTWIKDDYTNHNILSDLHGVNLDIFCADFFQGLAKHLTAVFAVIGGPTQAVNFRHGFAIRFQQRAGHFSHTDDCDLTLNTCKPAVVKTLRETGLAIQPKHGRDREEDIYANWVSGLMMRYQQSDFADQLKRIEAKNFYAIPFKEHQTIIHSGYQEHGSLATGYSYERMNLIMFFNYQYSFPLFTQFLDDIKVHVLKFVSVPDVVHLQRTSKGMNSFISQNQGLWKFKFQDYSQLVKKIPLLRGPNTMGPARVPGPGPMGHFGQPRPQPGNLPNRPLFPQQPYRPAQPLGYPNPPPPQPQPQPVAQPPPQAAYYQTDDQQQQQQQLPEFDNPQPDLVLPFIPPPVYFPPPQLYRPGPPPAADWSNAPGPGVPTAWPLVDMQGNHDWPSVFKAAYANLQQALHSDSEERGTIVQEIPMKAIVYTPHFQTLHDATVFLHSEVPDYLPTSFCQIQ